ncbi:MAG TPA: hypothetical protein PKI03_13415 [Pseudomonadota bacterium]|nr:hypothetical protein [Pseudomonadota bacterium]
MTAACQPQNSPERICGSFLRAVAEGDATLIFDQLSQPTQWALYTVQKNQARMRQLVQQSYPAGEQAQALSRLYAADAENGRDLFARLYAERYAASFRQRLGSGAVKAEVLSPGPSEPASPNGGELHCRRGAAGGAAFRFVREASGRYGLVELAPEWEAAQLRATHDLATVEKNAEIYRQAGGSMGPTPSPPPSGPAPAGSTTR